MSDARRKQSYLLDPRFQLKWTSYLVIVVLLVMAALGTIIARTAARASDTAEVAVEQAKKAYEESKANNAITRESVKLAAADNPTLLTVMDDSLAEVDKSSEKNLADIQAKHEAISRDRRNLNMLLIGSGIVLLAILIAMGVVITHRIVGPVHKMKRLLRRVSTGRLVIEERLRKGDELEDLFDTFLQMTYSLRAMQAARLATLDGAIKRAEAAKASQDVLDDLRALRAQMVLGLERRRGSMRPPAPSVP